MTKKGKSKKTKDQGEMTSLRGTRRRTNWQLNSTTIVHNSGIEVGCFPHCCPNHINRGYCGTSLSVRIKLEDWTLSSEIKPPLKEILTVFARFEAANELSIYPGECVEVKSMEAHIQSESNLAGQWVVGRLNELSGPVDDIRAQDTPPENSKQLVFHLNAKPFSHWNYDWESGTNKVQRLMKHVLKAYVVERCAVDQDGNFTCFTSPPGTQATVAGLHKYTDV
ncbi:hypothetical protein BBP00_00003339 [Phytophthora kernoviae]|uniref:Uncharacterized protein n=1 Tax=Phytophthora kernoviae TaxID=325452 RepID=A0A3F2RUR9_9STRA|nr:hypothetical protein BBP00_00003339 [Phytophthora kernoviae]